MHILFVIALILNSGIGLAGDVVQTVAGPRATGYLGLGKNVKYLDQPLDTSNLPEEWDWRMSNAVTPIKNQGNCGSCYSFGITASFESALIVQAGEEAWDLSEQEIVSCARDAYGCNGGFMTTADYIVKKGQSLEKSFPYSASSGRCKQVDSKFKAASYALLGSANRKPTVDEIKAAVIKYGISFVTVAAGGNGWSGNSGEITGCRNTGINHIVNIVGWTKNGKWKMRNSWGKSWGNQGYSLIKFGCDKIAQEAGIVIVE